MRSDATESGMRSVGVAERNDVQRRDSSDQRRARECRSPRQGQIVSAQSNVAKMRRRLVRRTPKQPVTLGGSEWQARDRAEGRGKVPRRGMRKVPLTKRGRRGAAASGRRGARFVHGRRNWRPFVRRRPTWMESQKRAPF
jgi:hypothetical protein